MGHSIKSRRFEKIQISLQNPNCINRLIIMLVLKTVHILMIYV